MNLFGSIAGWMARRDIRRFHADRERRFIPWESIRTIALIVGKKDAVNRSELDRFIDASGKHVEVYYLELSSKKATFADWHCLTREHRSLLGLPVEKTKGAMQRRSYDLVINASVAEQPFAATLAAALSAPFKCAGTGWPGDPDLVVHRQPAQGLQTFLAQVETYLKMIRPGTPHKH